MEKSTNNKKGPSVTSTGPSENHTINTLNSNGSNPAQLELTLETKANQPAIKTRKFGLKSTVTEAQYERVDRAFDYPGKLISTLDFRKMGVIHPSGRVREMNKKMGFHIATVELRTVTDDQGFPHPRIAFYELIDRPAQVKRV